MLCVKLDIVCCVTECKSWSRVKYSKGNLRKGDCWLHGGGQYKKYKDWINSGKKGTEGITGCGQYSIVYHEKDNLIEGYL